MLSTLSRCRKLGRFVRVEAYKDFAGMGQIVWLQFIHWWILLYQQTRAAFPVLPKAIRFVYHRLFFSLLQMFNEWDLRCEYFKCLPQETRKSLLVQFHFLYNIHICLYVVFWRHTFSKKIWRNNFEKLKFKSERKNLEQPFRFKNQFTKLITFSP